MNSISEAEPQQEPSSATPVPTLVIVLSRGWLVLVFVAVALLVVTGSADNAGAQVEVEWSEPQVIYETGEAIDTPYLVSDVFGQTHLVWREYGRETDAIPTDYELLFYDPTVDDWIEGTDVVAMPNAAAPTIAIDRNGTVHLMWVGPANTLLHSSAMSQTDSAHGWSRPVSLASSNVHSQIIADAGGEIHAVFPGLLSSGPFYLAYDLDQGVWSEPTNVAAVQPDASVDYTRVAIGPTGTIHVVWSEFQLPDGWPPTGVYYARSTDQGRTWSSPNQLAGPDYDQITVSTGSDAQVHVAWNGMAGVGGRYHRFSVDDGLSWSRETAFVPPGKGGTEGPPALAVDDSGVLHVLTTFDGCAWHVAWDNAQWTKPNCISGREAMASEYIEQPTMAVSNGNKLSAVFWDDRSRLWHTSIQTGASPTYAVLPTRKPIASATIQPTVTPTLTVAPTDEPQPLLSDAPLSGGSVPGSVSQSLLIGVLSALVLLGGVVFIRVGKHR